MFTRRKFIIIAGFIFAVPVGKLVGFGLRKWIGGAESFVVETLNAEYSDYSISTHSLQAFSKDFLNSLPDSHRSGFDAAWYRETFLSNGSSSKHSEARLLKEKIARSFLLSSNFFEKREGEPLRYVSLFDPYRSPCRFRASN